MVVAQLEPSDADRAHELLAACPVVSLPAGAARAGRKLPDAALVLVEGGPVVVRAPGRERRRVVTLVLGSGAVAIPPRPEDVVEALGDARLRAVPMPVAKRLLALPGAAQYLLVGLAATAGQLQEAAATFANIHHAERVRQKLARDFGHVDSGPGVRLDLALTHDLLAEMVGSARETVTRAVEELRREGFVARDGRAYRVLASPCALDPA